MRGDITVGAGADEDVAGVLFFDVVLVESPDDVEADDLDVVFLGVFAGDEKSNTFAVECWIGSELTDVEDGLVIRALEAGVMTSTLPELTSY